MGLVGFAETPDPGNTNHKAMRAKPRQGKNAQSAWPPPAGPDTLAALDCCQVDVSSVTHRGKEIFLCPDNSCEAPIFHPNCSNVVRSFGTGDGATPAPMISYCQQQ
jgi:hypothetical protein